VLQEREVVRLGSRTPIPLNVRLVGATNVNLADAVLAGNFGEDLFYGLHVATIRLPLLRERPGYILSLAEFFLEEHCQRPGYNRATLSIDAERKLLEHSWPGNIRELGNTIHHALLCAATSWCNRRIRIWWACDPRVFVRKRLSTLHLPPAVPWTLK
jgi:sigma-54-specific transcriptional regulator